jgi:predicted nucleic acid-binding protein
VTDAPALLDVNVPMYAAGRDHPYRQSCITILSHIADGSLAAAIDTEIIQEILYRYGALREWDVAVKMATNLLTLAPLVLPITPADAAAAVELFAKYAPAGVTARDLIHVAVMRNNGLTTIISTDAHFDRVDGITRLDPLKHFGESSAD